MFFRKSKQLEELKKLRKPDIVSEEYEITIDEKGCKHRKKVKTNYGIPLPTPEELEVEHERATVRFTITIYSLTVISIILLVMYFSK